MSREYDKLVRDDIPAVIEADGETPVTHVVDGDAYEERLFEKLAEETAELRAEPSADELADVLEVLDALRRQLGVDEDELEAVREKKAAERGRFDDGVVLERVED
ncbi:nucleoside triphosphate pyrophosphohydrolase [Halolamina salifodinae]|uniref:Putative house-cleaning noncanonical NTP pyrophosphatase (MazG superfamily) n=1 Tax=Halolamina salifodinae TaxID=1202767 RepID=A0A8T4GXA5_9EURY|nr:nucleoside triphosphate pyrophosphohydrolase [Halolamina salifodinae]MBP1987647.1 putative house-cleaning noncanonical NTP pyrophosphatase (MazG superfamily) [Halolamina salifodinae]